MNTRTRTLIAVGSLIVALAYLAAPRLVDASQPAYGNQGQVSRVEHLGIRINTQSPACVRIDWNTTKDAGAFLSGEPDAAVGYPFPGPDAAIFYMGANDASWVPPDATAGPWVRTLPKSGVNYICTARNNAACWKQGTVIDSCNYSAFLPADQPTPPFAFMQEPDGGQPMVFGVSTSGTANVECCPAIPSVLNGN